MPDRSSIQVRTGTGLADDVALLALASVLVLCLQTLFVPSHVPVVLKAEVTLVLLMTLWCPFAGLLIVAALVPFSAAAVLVWTAPHVLWADAVVFAFVAGWGLSTWLPGARRDGLDLQASIPVLLVGAVVLASCLVQLLQLATDEVAPVETLWRFLTEDLFFVGRMTAGLPEGVALLEGLMLFVASIALCRGNHRRAWRLAATVVGAAAAAAVLSILLVQGIALKPMLVRAAQLSMVRVAAHVSDVNAAGSYFAMMTCIALGMAGTTLGLRRAVWLGSGGLIAFGLWLTGSVAALAAGLVMLGLMTAQRRAARLDRILTARAILISMGLGVLALFVARRALALGHLSLRLQLLETSLRMLVSAPVFGVGIGQFYPLSRRFMSPELGWNYSLENAHNYFLQIAAELGLVGLAAFLYLLYAVWARGRTDAGRRSDLLGAIAGLGAFLGTWLTGHPLLVREVAYPFWMVLALVMVWADRETAAPKSEPRRRPRLHRVAFPTALLILFASAPFRAELPTRQTLMYGVYDWEPQPDGRRARWTERYATAIVRVETGSVDIPMRAPRPTGVDVAVDGREVERLQLTEAWQLVRLDLPPAAPDALYRRIDLRLARTWTMAEIEPGNPDARAVGIQIGDLILH